MKRVEIILSAAIEEDFITKCEENDISAFTKFVNVIGIGNSVPKQGDSVWPQFNTMFIIYCNDDKFEEVKNIVEALRVQYPSEGVACFVMENGITEI